MTLLTTTLILCLVGGDPGTTAFQLLEIGQGPRASAMGESFTGLSDDASAIYWNPAGLGQVAGHHFALSHQQWFFGIKDEIGHAAIPLGPGALGLGLVYSGDPDVRYWNAEEQRFDQAGTWDAMLTAGYGFRIADNYRLGASLTGLYQDLHLETGYGGAVDVGAVGRLTEALHVGLALRHLGVMSIEGSTEKLPMEGALGGAFHVGMFNLTADAIFPMLDNNPNFRGGIEFQPLDMLALRVGYRSGPVDLDGLGLLTGLCSGIGVTVGNFGLDYAIVPYGDLGLTHRIGIRTFIPPPTCGAQTIIVLDAETRERLVANIAVSGVVSTTATTDELRLTDVPPGDGEARVSLDEYVPGSVAFTVVAGRHGRDTVLLDRLTGAIVGGIYDAKTSDPIGGTLVYSGPLSGRLSVPAAPGTYEIKSAPRGSYKLDATGPTDEYLAQTSTVNVPAGQTVECNFYLWKKGDFLVLEGVNFETGKADILPQFYPILDRAGTILKQTPVIKLVELAGHTDPRDIKTPEFPSNWELSEARAEAVRQYLIAKHGIAPERLVAKGYADTKPVAPNDTPEGMAKNRRTELRILE